MGSQVCSCASRSLENGRLPGTVIEADVFQRFPSVEWEGFGCSLSWMALALAHSVHAEAMADLLFTLKDIKIERVWQDDMWLEGRRVPGLGLSIARYNVGGCGNEPGENTSELSPGDFAEIEGFQLSGYKLSARGKFNMNRDIEQRQFLNLAVKRGVEQVEMFSRAPMWWMSSSQSSFGGSLVNPDDFANYLTEVAVHFKNNLRVPVRSVAPFHEPSESWEFPAENECCNVSVDTQASVIKTLRANLDRRGLQDVIIAASDENTPSSAMNTWRSFRFSPTGPCVGRINIHSSRQSYDDSNRTESVGLGRLAREDGIGLWVSQHSDEGEDGMFLAQKIIEDLNCLAPSAWCYWQIIESQYRKSLGLIDAHMGEGRTDLPYLPLPKFYIFAHFTRFLRPGFRLLRLHSPVVPAVGGYSRKSSAFVAVLVNSSETSSTVNLVVPTYTTYAQLASAVFSRPTEQEFYVQRPIQVQQSSLDDMRMYIHMPPYSVCSLLVENVTCSRMQPSSLTASWISEVASHAGKGAAMDRLRGSADLAAERSWLLVDHMFGIAAEALEAKIPKQRARWMHDLYHLRSVVCNEAWATAARCELKGEKDYNLKASNARHQESEISVELFLVISYSCQAAVHEVYYGTYSKSVKDGKELVAQHSQIFGVRKPVISLR